MRVSVLKDDPGHEAFVHMFSRGSVVVLLDGVEQQHVVTADDVEGTVCRHVLDPDGNPQVDPANQNEVWCETVAGLVSIVTR